MCICKQNKNTNVRMHMWHSGHRTIEKFKKNPKNFLRFSIFSRSCFTTIAASVIGIIVNASHLKVWYELAHAVEGSNHCVHSFSTTYEYTAHPSESNLFSHINLKFNFHPIFSWKNHTNCTRERLFKGNSHHQLNLYPLQMYA